MVTLVQATFVLGTFEAERHRPAPHQGAAALVPFLAAPRRRPARDDGPP